MNMKFIFQIFCDFLSTHTKFFDFARSTRGATNRDIILCFTDMTKSNRGSSTNLMITNTYGTFFTLRNMSTGLTDNARGISFFVDENPYALALFEIFFYAFHCQYRKKWIEFFGHIHKENFLFVVME